MVRCMVGLFYGVDLPMFTWLKKASFPLPIRYEKPELRFTLRDGVRFAAWLQARGVDATKLLIGDLDTDQPESPLLKLASQEQWNNSEWWAHEEYDLVVVYGRPLAAMEAIRKGSTKTVLGLKMDSGYGVQTSKLPNIRAMIRRYPFYRYVCEYSFVRALVSSVGTIVKDSGRHAIVRQKHLLSLPHLLLYESPMAMAETAQWFVRNGVPDFAKKLLLAPHPVLESMTFSPDVDRMPHSFISVANWTLKYKDSGLLIETVVQVLRADASATFRIIGKGSGEVRAQILRHNFQNAGERVSAVEFVHPSEMHLEMQRAQVYVGTSNCESFGISVAEALCCGCSVALAPGIGVPSYRWFAEGPGECQTHGGAANDGAVSGSVADCRTSKAMARAVRNEFDRWDAGEFNPVESSTRWAGLCHTSAVLERIGAAAGFMPLSSNKEQRG